MANFHNMILMGMNRRCNIELLTHDFIDKTIKDNPRPLTELGEFVYCRTYSRWLPGKGRRETWPETVRRVCEYSVGLDIAHRLKIGIPVNMDKAMYEAQEMFNYIYSTRVFCSGRTLWIGGASPELNARYAMANFNCAFTNIECWEDLCDVFYLLMVGAGVGFKCTPDMAAKIAPIRTGTTLLHSEYRPLPPQERIESTSVNIMDNGYAKIFIGDSKEGWVDALRQYLKLLTEPAYAYIHTIKISYNSLRPKGERLKTFGGTASGHEQIQEMFTGIDKVLKNQIDPWLAPLKPVQTGLYQTPEPREPNGFYHVRPIHILDIGNLIGQNVVAGGVRRTAEMFIFDPDDMECLLAKYGKNGFWTDEHLVLHENIKSILGDDAPKWMDKLQKYHNKSDYRHGGYFFPRDIRHRSLSNNSAAFTEKPSRERLYLMFLLQQLEGDPNFINLEAAGKRRYNAQGCNPCGEIILDNKGVCNLVTQNMVKIAEQALYYARQDISRAKSIFKACAAASARVAARMAVRMTLIDLELPQWNNIHHRDTLIGVSMTGIKDAVGMFDLSESEEMELADGVRTAVHDAADAYAKELRIPAPLLCTTLKPEGTLSQVAGCVSSGNGYQKYPYFIRRIRISADDPLAKVALDLGWRVNPEVGTEGFGYDEKMKNASVWVIDFPVHSTSKVFEADVSAENQLYNYFKYLNVYTDHNPSNTITVEPDEWKQVEETIWEKWDQFIGLTFLPKDGGTYQLMPYEKITREEYLKMRSQMEGFKPELVTFHEHEMFDSTPDASECASGACPVR